MDPPKNLLQKERESETQGCVSRDEFLGNSCFNVSIENNVKDLAGVNLIDILSGRFFVRKF